MCVVYYRGISALSSVAKLFELAVFELIISHSRHYIDEDQHGFMPKQSTTTNLLSFTLYIIDGFCKAKQTDGLYLDLSTAFDSINHKIAIAKLAKLGFGGRFVSWLRSYLIGRQLTVRIEDVTSRIFDAPSGIPQGSHLGPLILLIYYNDVNKKLKFPRLSFADEMKIYFQISSLADARFLQQQLINFAERCATNRMKVNPNKRAVITFSKKKDSLLFNYDLFGTSIERTNCIKDLGVQLDS